MLRVLSVFIGIATLGLAFYLYQLKYETRALRHEVAQISKDITALKKANNVLRAEYSVLTSPSHLKTLAKMYGMERVKAHQLITFKDLKTLDTHTRQDPLVLPVNP